MVIEMFENMSGVRKVDVFNDIVSRLEDNKSAKVSDDVISGMKNYYNNSKDYRGRVTMLADSLKGVRPIDSQINNVVYLSGFIEKGIAIKSSITSFKQIWVEYRLIFNENSVKEEKENVLSFNSNDQSYVTNTTYEINSPVDSLDDNYKRLYTKVVNLNKYVEDFNKRKLELDRQIASLESKKRSLNNELVQLEIAKKEFERYKIDEQNKIDNLKNEVNGKVVSLQNLIDNLDDILGKVN